MNELSLSEMVGGFTEDPPRRSRRGSERRQRKRRRRTFFLVVIGLVVIGLLGAGAWVGLRPLISSLNQPKDYAGPGTGSVQISIPDGASGTAIGQVLQAKGVVLTVKGFVDAYSADPRSAAIQPGTYRLQLQMRSADAVAALLTEGSRLTSRFTLKEGVRAADVPKLIADKTKIPRAQLEAALKSPVALGLPAEAKGNPEGWLFPATYEVQPNTPAAGLLHQMVTKTIEVLDAKGVAEGQRQPVLIKASMVQAEARNAVDFPKIARVLENRLARKKPLQLDTTVHYATKKFTVFTSEADTKIKSPYNTYQVPGLPIGPIGNPGELAIDGVLSPAAGPWLYFVATNPQTGFTEYATTEAQFALLKAKSDAWTKAHPGQ